MTTERGSGAATAASPRTTTRAGNGGRRIYVMLGAPGAGKGTQADRLAEDLGIPHVSSGDLFRAAFREHTPLGIEARRYMERGALVPDDVTVRMVGGRLDQPDAQPGVILDGFPRTRAQAEALDAMLEGQAARVRAALYVEVDTDELMKRLTGRRVCTAPAAHVYHVIFKPPRTPGVCDVDGSPLEQRADDQPETIRARLDKQLPPMFEVVDHYAEQGKLLPVRGDQPIEAVTAELLHAIDVASRS